MNHILMNAGSQFCLQRDVPFQIEIFTSSPGSCASAGYPVFLAGEQIYRMPPTVNPDLDLAIVATFTYNDECVENEFLKGVLPATKSCIE